ncbi:uncharacterized protein LOC125381981 [Haliotis rufescens]|uniref:uncharacterized protein LOC125381981 n=1 Tax=Haliotis rufescens TaxID=6454 RepID=UPI001EAFA0D4|nr:uncharacterized protein LOC125381981 [Haliotis rufescens]
MLGPVKRIKKRYLDDPDVGVPQRTAARWKNKNMLEVSQASTSDDVLLESNIISGGDVFDHMDGHDEASALTQTDSVGVDVLDHTDEHDGQDEASTLAQRVSVVTDSVSEDSYSMDYNCASSSEFVSSDEETVSFESDDTDETSSDSDASRTDTVDLLCTDSNLSIQEIQAVKLLSCFLRNNLSASTCKDIIVTLREVYPESASIQKLTYENIWKFVDDSKMKECHYCVLCSQVFPDNEDFFACEREQCDGLRYKGPFSAQMKKGRQPRQSFVFADVKTQLSSLLQSPGIWKDIQERKKTLAERCDDILRDITDGRAYRRLQDEGQFLSDPNSLTAVLNTDGVNLYTSSKIELWPIFLSVNEMTPSLRFARDNMLLVGIWQGKGKPPFQPYIHLLSKQLNPLYEEGIQLSTTAEEWIPIKLSVVCGIFDLPAKAGILNMTYYNGTEACITCEEPGVVVQQGRGHSRCYPFRPEHEKHPFRNDTDVRLSMERGTERRRSKGFKGKSGLLSLKGFDLVIGVVPDYMHGVLLGVTKTLMYKWFSSTESRNPFFVGNKLKEISSRLQSIKPIECIERLPRDIEKHYSNFKATELQAWLLYYAVPCLLDILPDVYLKHFASLSEAVILLLGEQITHESLCRARCLLESFYKKFGDLYPPGSCGLNVHNIGEHLCFYVKEWGPMWAWSCFAFEDANAMLLQSVHGTGNVLKQVMRARQARVFLRTLDITQGECSKWKKLQDAANCSMAGSLQPVAEDDLTEEIFRRLPVTNLREVKKVSRVLNADGKRLYAEAYTRMQKRDCSVVLLQDGSVASIKYFALCLHSNVVYAILNLYKIEGRNVVHGFPSGLHIIPVSRTRATDCVLVEQIVERLILISTNADSTHNLFVARLPNIHGHSIFK